MAGVAPDDAVGAEVHPADVVFLSHICARAPAVPLYIYVFRQSVQGCCADRSLFLSLSLSFMRVSERERESLLYRTDAFLSYFFWLGV